MHACVRVCIVRAAGQILRTFARDARSRMRRTRCAMCAGRDRDRLTHMVMVSQSAIGDYLMNFVLFEAGTLSVAVAAVSGRSGVGVGVGT